MVPPPNAPPDVPAWLTARRERQAPAPAVPAVNFSKDDPPPVADLVVPAAEDMEFPQFRHRSRQSWMQRLLSWINQVAPGADSKLGWLGSWISRGGIIGVTSSLLLHATILGLLTFIVIGLKSPQEETEAVWGLPGDVNLDGGDFTLDSELPIDAGESAPLQMTDVSKLLEGSGANTDLGQSLRVGTGGKGNGQGESGEGTEAGIGSLRIPGYAQTKGSFSAWAEPRNPRPGEEYNIVVLIKLPGKSGKYKASDLTGFVKGTDNYDQKIRYKSNQTFPVEDGTVKILIQVPGAARLVRDTVQVESKMLHEKQTFEIVFDGPMKGQPQ